MAEYVNGNVPGKVSIMQKINPKSYKQDQEGRAEKICWHGVCWWKHWYPCNKHLSMSTVHQWFQQYGDYVYYMSTKIKKAQRLQWSFPRGMGSNRNGSNVTSTCYNILFSRHSSVVMRVLSAVQRLLVTVWLQISVLHGHLLKMMALMSAKPTQFSFSLCHSIDLSANQGWYLARVPRC